MPNDCGHGADDQSALELDSKPTHVDAWYSRQGTRLEGLGIVAVHADGDDPLEGDRLVDSLASERNGAWVKRLYIASTRNHGLGGLALDPKSHGSVRYFRTLPASLLRQRGIMQCMRGQGYTTRFDHQLRTGYVSGMIAAKAGLSRHVTEQAALAGLVHDDGHDAFAHGSEESIGKFKRRHNLIRGNANHDHAEVSAHRIAALGPGDPALDNIVHGIRNHSWHLRHGVAGSSAAGVIADLSGAGDRVAYALSDTGDALRAGRITMEEIPFLMPRAVEFARFSPSDLQELTRAPLELAIRKWQLTLEARFIESFAHTIRETGIVGLSFADSDVLKEIRQNSTDRLFRLEAHEKWEEQLILLCDLTLDRLLVHAERDSYEDDAPQEAMRRFAALNEKQVITFARVEKLDFPWRIVDSAPKVEVPRATAVRHGRGLRERRGLLPLHQLLGPLQLVEIEPGRCTELYPEDAMTLLGLLNAEGNEPVHAHLRAANGMFRYKVPQEVSERERLFQTLENSLEAALTSALQRAQEVESNNVWPPSPLTVRDDSSLRFLRHLTTENHGRPAAILRGYNEHYFAGRGPRPDVPGSGPVLGPELNLPVLSLVPEPSTSN